MRIPYLIFLTLLFIHSNAWANMIKKDEWIKIIPGAAKLQADGKIKVTLSAWVYEKESRPGAQAALALWMKLDLDKLTQEERERFAQRTQFFRVDSERSKTVILIIGDKKIRLPLTDPFGFTTKKIMFELPDVYQKTNVIEINAKLPKDDPREFRTNFPLLYEEGISIVSDIDDTIKDSHVLNKQVLLRNTFVNPLHAVHGMSDLYQTWALTNKNLGFHYVSSSPIQLYNLLMQFLAEEKFPAGSLHLRQVKLRDEIFKEGSSSQRHKYQQIRQLIKDFPKRQFILIGDSGEADPEIYAEIARDNPEAIRAIAIRDVTQESADSARYQKTFAGVDNNKWRIFSEPAELKNLLD